MQHFRVRIYEVGRGPWAGPMMAAVIPNRAARVLGQMRDCRGGQLYVSDWGTRMKGSEEYSKLLAQRFAPGSVAPRAARISEHLARGGCLWHT